MFLVFISKFYLSLLQSNFLWFDNVTVRCYKELQTTTHNFSSSSKLDKKDYDLVCMKILENCFYDIQNFIKTQVNDVFTPTIVNYRCIPTQHKKIKKTAPSVVNYRGA